MKGRECQHKHIDSVTLTLRPIQAGRKKVSSDKQFLLLQWKWKFWMRQQNHSQSEQCVDEFFWVLSRTQKHSAHATKQHALYLCDFHDV